MADKVKMINIDPEKCTSCHSCELACAVAHSKNKTIRGAMEENPQPVKRIRIIGSSNISLPIQCRHCETAFCVNACPTDALKKENGIVYLEEELCTNCKICMKVCPFGAIQDNKNYKVIIKCDLCRERLKKGKEPACVVACPTSALTFIDPDDIKETAFIKDNADNGYLYPIGKIKITEALAKTDQTGKKIEKKETCVICEKKIIPTKKIEEARESALLDYDLELFNFCPDHRAEHILNSIKSSNK